MALEGGVVFVGIRFCSEIFTSEKYDKEGRTVTLEFDSVFVVNTYWPNSGDKLAKLPGRREWNKQFVSFVETLKHKHVIVAGDLNVAPHPVDLHNPKVRT